MKLAHTEWRNRVQAEYGSAALTAQIVHWMIQLGLPFPLVHTGLRIVRDELDHAELSHACLVALGGDPAAAPVDPAALALPAPDGPLAGLVDSIGRTFCLGETLAVPLFAAMRQHATHPAARAVLDRVLKDEAVHRAFGWQVLDQLLDIDAEGVRARLQTQLPGWLSWFETAYGSTDTEPDADDLAVGLLSAASYQQIYAATVISELRPRFAKRGIHWPTERADAEGGADSHSTR